MNKPQLIFAYNAYGGWFDSITGFAHKIISPSTYECRLCALTYGNFTMKEEWKIFIENLPADVYFFHKNDFTNQYNMQPDLPAIFIKEQNLLRLFASNKEIDNCGSLQQLKELISSKLVLHDQHHHSHLQRSLPDC